MSPQTTPANPTAAVLSIPPSSTPLPTTPPAQSLTPASIPTNSAPAHSHEEDDDDQNNFEDPYPDHQRHPLRKARLPLTTPFNPSPELIEKLLLMRIDPCISLGSIASTAGLTFDDLFQWFDSPEIVARLDRLRKHALLHIQEHAVCALRQALPVLTRILQECDYALGKHAIQNQDSKGHELHRRIGETGMRAIAILHRLATNPASPTGRPPEKEPKPKPNSKQEKKPLPPPAPKESYSALLARLFPENVPPPAITATPNQPLPS